MTGATRAVATRQEVVRADTLGSTVITAEIPAVPVHRSYGVLLPDGSVWYPGSKRKLPAPWPLRFFVWVVALTLMLMLIGLVVVEWQPSWLSTLRHTVGSAPTLTLTGGGQGQTQPTVQTSASSPPAGAEWKCVVATTAPAGYAGGEACTIGISSYTIVFNTAEPCSVQVSQVGGPQGGLYQGTQAAGQRHPVVVTGATTVVAYHGGASISILDNGQTVGTALPANYDWLYTFQPS